MAGKRSTPAPLDPVVAVLTGDLVASRRHGGAAVEAAMARIRDSARQLSALTGADTRFTRFRGDGWQIVLGRARWALRGALVILADLRAAGPGIETRIAIGIGPCDSLGTADLSDAAGRAFALSGALLDALPGHRRLAIAGGRTAGGAGVTDADWQAAILDLVEWIAARWSVPQAEAIGLALRGDGQTQDDLARRLGITRQAMQARLRGAGFQAMGNALAAIEGYDWGAVP